MSNTLLTGLGVLGGLVLAGVIAYNEIQQRKAQLRTAEGESAARKKQFLHEHQAQDMVHADALARIDPRDDSALLHPLQTPAAGQGQIAHRLDRLIDSVVTLELAQPVYGQALLAAMPPTRRVGSKPFYVEALSAERGLWEYPQPNTRYSAVQAGVLLANRSGALNQIEFSEFVVKTQSFADAIGAEVDFPDMLAEVARARELDEFARDADAQLEFRIHTAGAPWSAGFVQQHAQRHGFVPGMRPGRMVYPATLADGATLPVLALEFDAHAALADEVSDSAVRDILLTLDVPQVPREIQPYALMRDVAIKLAASMGGQIVDGENRIIALQTMQDIGIALEDLYNRLEARDLTAGTAAAQRLFA